MSHQPKSCTASHTWGPWTSEQITNAAREQQYVLQRRCFACGMIEEEPAAVVEENPPTDFKERLTEPDRYNADD